MREAKSADNTLALETSRIVLQAPADDEAQSEQIERSEEPAGVHPRKLVSNPHVDLSLIGEMFPAPEPLRETTRRSRRPSLLDINKESLVSPNSQADDEGIQRWWRREQPRSSDVGQFACQDTRFENCVKVGQSEYRISGRGPGGRASFFWDHPKAETQTPRALFRHKPFMSVSSSSQPVHQNGLPTNASGSAAFNWSSTSAPTNPWEQNIPSITSPLPFAANPTTVPKARNIAERSVSVDFARHALDQSEQRKTTSPQVCSPAQSSPDVQRNVFVSIPPTTDTESWIGLGVLDTNSHTPDDGDG